ncbi:Conserved hypothetical protein, precursor (plasmid) [Deinococcus deserti VCD115]|uniref:Glycosyl hydrolase-like 10 domain-containing protein n=1 Tax=Deinococcus deserti (strain DSM 17065 / CIP 109153 / LMG 22923 / VCD115) TaxID=546414 RepID=C1D298_DEIDV|nr:family 10 glycosylhydrolase [Deinococcus deserti]ACO47537.1 Conserved hypothetical protein, precursor [Deinococcus deserti VCD115]
MRRPSFALLAITLTLSLVACPRSTTAAERQTSGSQAITGDTVTGVDPAVEPAPGKVVGKATAEGSQSVAGSPQRPPAPESSAAAAPEAASASADVVRSTQEKVKAEAQVVKPAPVEVRPATAASTPMRPTPQVTAEARRPAVPVTQASQAKPAVTEPTVVKPSPLKAASAQPVQSKSAPAKSVPTKSAPPTPAPARPAPMITSPVETVSAPVASKAVEPAPVKPAVIKSVQKPAATHQVAESRRAPGPLQTGPAMRGLWVDAFGPGFKTPGEVDRLIADARAMNINTLFVQAVKRGDCYCNGSLLPRTEDPAVPAEFDPLADVLTKAHAHGIKVHAWVIPTAVSNRAVRYPVTNPEHVVNAHGEGDEQDWLMRNSGGSMWAGNDQQLDIGHPDARRYMVDAIQSVAAAYNIDGVQLDRVRYPDPSGTVQDWGYNPGAVAAYQAESETTETPAPGDARWTAWRREQVNALVSEVSGAVRSARPGTVISVAAITYGAGPRTREAFASTRTYAEVLQDWPLWLADGNVDLVVLMNYKREAHAGQARDFDSWNRFAKSVKAGGQVAAGTALYLNTAQENLVQVRRAVEQGLDGWVGYSYRTPELGVEEGRKAGDKAYRELRSLLVGESAARH